jgi:hypothetical protein
MDDETNKQDVLGAFRHRADIERELSDPTIDNDRHLELIDELLTLDSGLGPLRRAMGTTKTENDEARAVDKQPEEEGK